MKLLAVRLDAAGDVLMCSPALHALASGGHRVSLLTSAAGALAGACIAALESVDGMRSVLRFDAPWMKASAPCAPDAVPNMATQLQAMRFDGAVIFTSHTQSALPAALLCQMAGIPLRLAHCRENPYQLLTHWVRDPEPVIFRHEVQRQLDLVATLGCAAANTRLRIDIDAADQSAARQLLEDKGLADDESFVLIHPGASAPSRRYPEQRWHELVSLLVQRMTLPIVIAGGPGEMALATSLCALAPRCINVSGKTSFGMLAALIARARVLIACNSAPTHLAAATGTPVVDLYALTNLQHMPWQVAHRVLFDKVACAGCLQSVCPQPGHPCLSRVSAARVLRAVQELHTQR